MTTVAKQVVSIQDLVAGLRQLPRAAFDETAPIRKFLQDRPVEASSVHNHRDQNCWMAAPIGRLQLENFRVVREDLSAGSCELEPADILEMNIAQPCAVDPREPVHRVVNPRQFGERAVSLHVYSRPFDSCVVYSAEQGTCGEVQLHYQTAYGKSVAR